MELHNIVSKLFRAVERQSSGMVGTMAPIKSVAVIGAGPAGAITVDALAQEQEFEVIKVFERREKAGGCW